MKKLIGVAIEGRTTYSQATANLMYTGELFDLPAGAVGGAVGAEYRWYAINDQPSALSRTGGVWLQSTADVTKGSDQVLEAFSEIEVPIVKGIRGIESLTLNGSARVFRYDVVDGIGDVWKLGLNWQFNSIFRARGSIGTSFRAPGLFELHLGNQSGFLPQTAVDPCIRWGQQTHEHLRANCAAAGIADDFNGAGTSAVVYSQGGGSNLQPERSKAISTGIVITPTFADINVAIDYFDYDIRDEIGLLDSEAIVGQCYAAPIHPNRFCGLFERAPGGEGADAHAIKEVRSTYLNINRQRLRGYELSASALHELPWGKLDIEANAIYTLSDKQQLFSSTEASGFSSSELVGLIGRPKLTATLDIGFQKDDWSFLWQARYIGRTENTRIESTLPYVGYPDARIDTIAEARWYHTASVTYDQSDWSLTIGMNNVFNVMPPSISAGVAPRHGNVPVMATQYDYLGRSGFASLTYRF